MFKTPLRKRRIKHLKFDEWMRYGVDNKWISMPVCEQHEGAPMTDEEAEEVWGGHDPCIFVMRVWAYS